MEQMKHSVLCGDGGCRYDKFELQDVEREKKRIQDALRNESKETNGGRKSEKIDRVCDC